jgi:hypothetical protein
MRDPPPTGPVAAAPVAASLESVVRHTHARSHGRGACSRSAPLASAGSGSVGWLRVCVSGCLSAQQCPGIIIQLRRRGLPYCHTNSQPQPSKLAAAVAAPAAAAPSAQPSPSPAPPPPADGRRCREPAAPPSTAGPSGSVSSSCARQQDSAVPTCLRACRVPVP